MKLPGINGISYAMCFRYEWAARVLGTQIEGRHEWKFQFQISNLKFQTPARKLMAQLQLLRDRLIAFDVRVVEIIQQTTALADHHQQPATRAVIFLVALQVFGQMVDPLRQQGNLHVCRTSVSFVQLK